MAGINDIYQGLSKRKEKKRTNGIMNANIGKPCLSKSSAL